MSNLIHLFNNQWPKCDGQSRLLISLHCCLVVWPILLLNYHRNTARSQSLCTLKQYASEGQHMNYISMCKKYTELVKLLRLYLSWFNPRGDHWAEFGPRDQCRLCARPKFGPTWYDVVEQFSFPSLVTDPGKKGVIGKLIHSSSCANFNQVQNAVSPNENPRYKTRGKVVPIFG